MIKHTWTSSHWTKQATHFAVGCDCDCDSLLVGIKNKSVGRIGMWHFNLLLFYLYLNIHCNPVQSKWFCIFIRNQRKEIISQSEGDQKSALSFWNHLKKTTNYKQKITKTSISNFLISLRLSQHNVLTPFLRLYFCSTLTISAMTVNTVLGN